MYQRILVPVDGSQTSDLALREAIRFVQQFNSMFKLVHVIEDARFYDAEQMIDYASLQDMARRSGEKVLEFQELRVALPGGRQLRLLQVGEDHQSAPAVGARNQEVAQRSLRQARLELRGEAARAGAAQFFRRVARRRLKKEAAVLGG